MKHRDTTQSVLICTGLYSTTIFEMEIWSIAKKHQYTNEEYLKQIEDTGCMNCGLRRERVGLFPTKERALEDLDMMYEDSFGVDKDLYCAFIREKAMCCMMHPSDYLKEWTYVYGLLRDESLVRNFAEKENPFCGRPKEMVRFKKGDIVMIPDMCGGHWGIVWETPVTPDFIQEVNDRIERETGVPGTKYSTMDWSDDHYTILTNGGGFEGGHEHVLAHHVLPAPTNVPDFVCEILESNLHAISSR